MSEKYRIERWKEIYPPYPSMLRLLMVLDGYRVEQWGSRSQMIIPKQKHSLDRSHWIVSGALKLAVDDVGIFVLEAGDRDFMTAETRYSAQVVSEEPVIYLVGQRAVAAKAKRKKPKKVK